jgi:UbiD family decarboxylase
MGYFKDIREHLQALEQNNKLIRVKREINKDTELMPLVRWQFRGLPEEERKAFLFENVVDVKGKKYDGPVLVGSHAASSEVFAIGMNCRVNEIVEKWARAELHPISPKLIGDGPIFEEIHRGPGLLEHGGLEEFPTPISTPGFDNAPYICSACWVSKDPETGIRNVGTYRAMIKGKARTGCLAPPGQDLRTHWEKCRKQGKNLQAAIVLGAVPAIGFTSTTKLPYGVDEYAVSGGIAGEPIELVRCKTVDLEVPATSEIVIEGEIPIDVIERDGPFGEFSGYMGTPAKALVFNVTCIMHRRQPIYNAFMSQFRPSEGSKIQVFGVEGTLLKFLRHDCNLPVLDVASHENCGSRQYIVIKMKKTHPSQVWQALHGVVARFAQEGKIIIAVDEDINPRDPESINWAMCWRIQPDRDIRVVHGRIAPLDYSVQGPGESGHHYPGVTGASALLIDATMKWSYPPHSLPKKEFMEKARKIWEELGLPALNPKEPWYGSNLGYWTDELEDEANLALKGEHYQTADKLAKQKMKP